MAGPGKPVSGIAITDTRTPSRPTTCAAVAATCSGLCVPKRCLLIQSLPGGHPEAESGALIARASSPNATLMHRETLGAITRRRPSPTGARSSRLLPGLSRDTSRRSTTGQRGCIPRLPGSPEPATRLTGGHHGVSTNAARAEQKPGCPTRITTQPLDTGLRLLATSPLPLISAPAVSSPSLPRSFCVQIIQVEQSVGLPVRLRSPRDMRIGTPDRSSYPSAWLTTAFVRRVAAAASARVITGCAVSTSILAPSGGVCTGIEGAVELLTPGGLQDASESSQGMLDFPE